MTIERQDAESAPDPMAALLQGLRSDAAAAGIDPDTLSSFEQLAAAAFLQHERPRIEAGGPPLLEAIAVVLRRGIAAPRWLAEAFDQRWQRFEKFEAASLDQVFDHRPDQDRELRAKAKQRALLRPVHAAVVDAIARDPAATISPDLFAAVAQQVGSNATDCAKLYYRAVREFGLVDAKELRREVRRRRS